MRDCSPWSRQGPTAPAGLRVAGARSPKARRLVALEGGAARGDRRGRYLRWDTLPQTDRRQAPRGVRRCRAERSGRRGRFNPPPHSIAVLPFVNLSGDKDQEYFSDGLTEELLNSLAEIDGLQVAARTSAFSFKGRTPISAPIARKLNVGAVLEGSVRRSAHTIRITAQLINAVTGFHLWSKTYDRD